MTNTLADRYAAAKEALDAAEQLVKELRREILVTGGDLVEGESCNVVVSLSERNSLDQTMVRSMLTEEQIAACSKVALIETLRIKHKKISSRAA